MADFGLTTLVDLSATLLSITAVSSAGTFCWMSPELLDPTRFGSSGRPTRESDCYALGMVIYEVSGTQSFVTMFPQLMTSGSYWPPTVPSVLRLHSCSRDTERRAPRKTSWCRIARFFPCNLGTSAVLLERGDSDPTHHRGVARLPSLRLSHLGTPFDVPCYLD